LGGQLPATQRAEEEHQAESIPVSMKAD